MKSFRFSPVKNKDELFKALEYIHHSAHKICKQNLGKYLPVAGNIGFFCHFEDEFEFLTQVREVLTDINSHWNHKYFKLNTPIFFKAKNGIPKAIYTYLYIRKPDDNTPNVGDVDFYIETNKFKTFKQLVSTGKFKTGVKILDRPDLDLVRLYNPNIDVSAFIGSYDLEQVAKHKQL